MKSIKTYSIVVILLLLLTFIYFFFLKTVTGPMFFVEVQLSEKAKIEFLNYREKLTISATFDGDAKEGYGGYNAPHRDVYLGSETREIELGETAHFHNINFREREFKKLKDNQYIITLNTISGGGKGNSLSCSVPIGLASDFNNKTIIVTCKTISEFIASLALEN